MINGPLVAVLCLAAMAVGGAHPVQAAEASSGAGVGVRPTTIVLPDALRGGESMREFGIINGASEAREFTLAPTGELADWMSVIDWPDRTPLDRTVVEAQSTRQLTLSIDVPEGTPNGMYAGAVRVIAAPSEGDADLGVGFGAEVRVALEVVGAQTISAEVVGVESSDTEPGLPMRLLLTLRNDSNVLVTPAISYGIDHLGAAVEELEHGPARAAPGDITRFETTWDTTDHSPGTYTIHPRVELPGLVITPEPLAVVLHPRGTLTRSGSAAPLLLDGTPVVGRAARLTSAFTNTGRIEATAVLSVEVQRDGELVGGAASSPARVDAGQVRDLAVLIDIDEPGHYEIDGEVSFDGLASEPLSLSFTVDPATRLLLPLAGSGAVLIITIGLLVSVFRNSRPRDDIASTPEGRPRVGAGV